MPAGQRPQSFRSPRPLPCITVPPYRTNRKTTAMALRCVQSKPRVGSSQTMHSRRKQARTRTAVCEGFGLHPNAEVCVKNAVAGKARGAGCGGRHSQTRVGISKFARRGHNPTAGRLLCQFAFVRERQHVPQLIYSGCSHRSPDNAAHLHLPEHHFSSRSTRVPRTNVSSISDDSAAIFGRI